MKRIENLLCGLKIQKIKKYECIQVYGDTYKFRFLLRTLNGEWNKDIQRWEFPLDDGTDKLLNELRNLPPMWVCCLKAVVKDVDNKIYSCEEHGRFPKWFCHHAEAKIINLSRRHTHCKTCSPCERTGGFLVDGSTYTGD